ncbi:cytochrome b [Halomonadaceae bacterium KBTZ08]
MIKDNPERYGVITRALHWLFAVLVLWQFMKFFDRIAEGEHWIGETLVPWHVSIGVLLLVLIVVRVAWALSQASQRPTHEPPIRYLARAGHILIYGVLVLMPITGMLYMVGEGYGVEAFGLTLVGEGDEVTWMHTLGELHEILAWTLLALTLAHIAMAFFHQFVRRDGTLKRMA